MKKGNFTKLVLLSALALPAYAEKVQFDQLPPDLQQKIRAQVGGAQIEDIDRETKNGRTIYEVAYKENGQHREAQIEHNVSTASTTTSTSSAVDSRKISYDELPQHVKNAVSSYVQAAEVNDVDRQVKDGRVTYEIGYKLNDGVQQELLVSDDGRILNRGSIASSSTSSSTTTTRPYRNQRGGVLSGPRSTASTATRTMEYEDLPSAVRTAAQARLSDGDVSQVYRLIQNGNVSYQIDFRKEDGRTQQLVIAEDGRITSDRFVTGSAVGAPASVQSGTSSSTTTTSDYSNITNPIQLVNAQEINRAQMPVGVARTMRNYTVNTNIKDIQRGTWNGREVYQVGFVDNNNQYVQLQLDANGNVIHDPRQNNPTTPTGNLLNNIGRLFDNK